MGSSRGRWFLVPLSIFTALLLALYLPVTAGAAGIDECLECHDDIDAAAFGASPHAKVQCVGCHAEVTDIAKHEDGEIDIGPVDCAKCHKDAAKKVATSVHAGEDVKCADCHAAIHELPAGMTPAVSASICSECHDTPFAGSVHGVALTRGEKDSPSCATCHSAHEVKPLGETTSPERRRLAVEACKPCHADVTFANEHGLSSEYVACYEESYHGKVYTLGYCDRVAGCTDCHTAHDIRTAADPASSVNEANLAATCGVERCHPGANINFALYAPHGSHRDKEKYPVFYWTFKAMVVLLVSVFAFFWLHTILWWQRAFRENREKRGQAHHAPSADLALEGEVYQRFSWFGVFLHLLVIVSFIILSLTGLPLKFAHAPWAPALMKFWGGAAGAGLWHRIGALITFAYFLAVNVMVIKWLFFKKTGEGLIQKFFGPDSLFPNFKDGRDISGMFKWFFNAGPRPQFGRWTYWEKFDFLAVYWGMFAIGFTGLVLWFPTWFAKFMPGWLFNVCTIVHSDEALLATGFIFTVHFFNTHLRPEKFPMDMVIFTGNVSAHEMIEERPEQIKLEKQRGAMEKMKTCYSAGSWEFVSQVIGWVAVVLGLVCLYFIYNGLFGH